MNLKSLKGSTEPIQNNNWSVPVTKPRPGLLIYHTLILQVPIQIRRYYLRQFMTKRIVLRHEKPHISSLKFNNTRPLRVISHMLRPKHIRHLQAFVTPTTLFRFKVFGLTIKYRMKLATYERICFHYGLNSVKELQSLKFLKNLTLYFDKSAYSVPLPSIISLKRALISMKGLESLGIIPQESPLSLRKPLRLLHDCKNSMTKLRKLSFQLPYFRVVTAFLESLQVFLGTHPLVESISLNYEGDEISEDDHHLMLKSLAPLNNLKKLHIGYNWCTVVPTKQLKKIVKHRHLELKNLSFSILNTQIAPEALSFMIRSFASRTPPTHLSMTILNCPGFGQEQFQLFPQVMSGFTELQNLIVRIAPICEISQEDRLALYNGLNPLKKLTTLTMELKPVLGNMTDYDLEILGSKLQNLTQLEYLDLYFDMHYDISDKGFQVLFSGISHLSNLHTFKICVEKKTLVTDETVKALRDCLGSLKLLKVLGIRIFKCRLTSECCKELWQGIRNLEKLQSLTLRLTNNQLEDIALVYLKNLLLDQKQLTELNLAVPIFRTETGIQALVDGISFLKNVKVLQLKIDSISLGGLSRKGADQIKDEIKKLPNLRKLVWEIPSTLGVSYEAELYDVVKTLEFVSWEEIN